VALAGAGSSLWHIRGGNKHLSIALLNHTKTATVHFSTQISSISQKDSKKFVLSTSNYQLPTEYDRVIIATPLEYSNIKIPSPKPPKLDGKYHRTVATVVAGHLKDKYHVLGDILTSDTGTFFTCLSRVFPTGLFVAEKFPVYKIFSPDRLKESQLDELFKKVEFLHVDDWLAYPDYPGDVDKKIPPFKLGDAGIYYVNGVEWTASAIEMSLVGAKNVALMVAKDLGMPCVPPKPKKSLEDREEL